MELVPYRPIAPRGSSVFSFPICRIELVKAIDVFVCRQRFKDRPRILGSFMRM